MQRRLRRLKLWPHDIDDICVLIYCIWICLLWLESSVALFVWFLLVRTVVLFVWVGVLLTPPPYPTPPPVLLPPLFSSRMDSISNLILVYGQQSSLAYSGGPGVGSSPPLYIGDLVWAAVSEFSPPYSRTAPLLTEEVWSLDWVPV